MNIDAKDVRVQYSLRRQEKETKLGLYVLNSQYLPTYFLNTSYSRQINNNRFLSPINLSSNENIKVKMWSVVSLESIFEKCLEFVSRIFINFNCVNTDVYHKFSRRSI
uniref:Uncharacterized protein n=1 Tax=Cacopsylla melanoneura TaxID=428564 RepID=A0A8D8LK67_9HEMI